MKLIMNADDFGYSRGINWGIIDAFSRGIVRSTTLMPNMPGFCHAVRLAKHYPNLGVGVHLVLTCGKPLTVNNRTIIDSKGNFLRPDVLAENIRRINLKEVEKEFMAQIEKVLLSGVDPTHLDSHHHVHTLPGIDSVFLKISSKYNLPVRLFSRDELPPYYKDVKAPDLFITDFFDENVRVDFLIELLERYKASDNIIEIMCHPAYVDHAILTGSTYNTQRTAELDVLINSEIAEYVKKNNIGLVNFKEL